MKSEDQHTPTPDVSGLDFGKPKEEQQDPAKELIRGILKPDWEDAKKAIEEKLPLALQAHWAAEGLESYNPIYFFDQINSIGEDHADRIYSAISSFRERKDILLMIGSRGGRIEPAYLISKNCGAASKTKFVVSIPRKAKSAATLIALGANEIHMGAMSELGPIDPQLGRLPALSLSNALTTISRLVCEHPGSADMFAKYLGGQLDLGKLGYFERINESAIQYASRLLDGKKLGADFTPDTLAHHLVNHYKDHSFVIDKDEAVKLFGDSMIRIQTAEYKFSNAVDQNLRLYARLTRVVHKKQLTFVGAAENCLKVEPIDEEG